MSENNQKRPLSPHLQIYKPQITSTLSILHRATGVALAIGTLMVVCILVAAASGEADYNKVMEFWDGPLGTFMTFGWSVALFYHSINGLRHLAWDLGIGIKNDCNARSGVTVLILTAIVTAIVWLV